MHNLVKQLRFLLFTVIAISGCNGKPTVTPTIPDFGKAYQAKGRVMLPYAELDEPFEIYYNETAKMGRIDYYHGLDKVFYRGDMQTYGTTFKISPSVSGQGTAINPVSCFQINGTKDNMGMPQTMLPNTTGFQYMGQKTLDDVMTNMWQLKDASFPAKVNTYTLYLTANSPVVPVRYEMSGYDSLLGSHYDKYVIEYKTFDNASTIPMTMFAPPKGIKCTGFPGPGIEQHIVSNPYRELVNPAQGDRYHELFNDFKMKHSKKYGDDVEHERKKMQFTHNVRYIHGVNRQSLSYTLGINHLADQSTDEMRLMRGRRTSTGYNGGQPFQAQQFQNTTPPPDYMDWRLMGAVTQVKDQAICGSCWSFGATETIEGAYFLKNKNLVRFSQQNLMDCSWGYGNNGCDGGEEWRAYRWIMKNGGLMSESDYGSYLGQNGICHYDAAKASVQIDKYVNITTKSLTDLKSAIATIGPIAVGIDASHKSFSFYSSGVYYEKDCGSTAADLDHAVLAVGYGQMVTTAARKTTTDYWIIKNSWSTYWGNNGYVLMNQKDNNCGVATDATYVVLK